MKRKTEEAEEKKRAAMSKRRTADFDESGARSTLETEFEEIASKMVKITGALLAEIKDTTDVLQADPT